MTSFVGTNPPCRWIVNFDVDFMDGLVFASLVGAHVPFVVSSLLFVYSVFTNYFTVYTVASLS